MKRFLYMVSPVLSGRSARRGATLTEVLMSILIMGIGVTSLATLFPISVLKSVQAHKLTNATNLRYAAEGMLRAFPELLSDPDADFNANLPAPTTFVLDPLGYVVHNTEADGLQNVVGNDGAGNPNAASPIPRYHGRINSPLANAMQLTTLQNAEYVVAGPDSWTTLYTGIPESTAADRKSVTMPSNQPINGITLPDPSTDDAQVRAVLFDGPGRKSQTRALNSTLPSISGQVISWADELPAEYNETTDLNGNGVLDSVSSVRIEMQERRFTWLLTARVDSQYVADIDIVVFFKRSFSDADETLHEATFNVTSSTVPIVFTGAKPNYKKGGYLFDAKYGYWYRIINISNETNSGVTLTIHQPPRSADTSNGGKSGVCFMQGIVDVYPLGQWAIK